MKPEPELSVIVVTWNSALDLAACLGSVRADEDVAVQVICVDNASSDDSAAIAEDLGAEVIVLDRNEGFPVAVNRGLEVVEAPSVLLLNPDVVLDRGTLRRCLDVLGAGRDIGIVGANLRRPSGEPDHAAARRYRSLTSIASETFGLTRVSPRLDRQYMPEWDRTSSRDVDCVNGAFVMMRTETLRDFGGLDTTVFMYLEDIELCRQVWHRGLRVHFVADATATHLAGASTRRATLEQQTIAYLHRTDADVEFVHRHRGRAARVVALLLFTVRALFGYAVGVLALRSELRYKYRVALGWLIRQVPRRVAPPPVP